MRATIQIVITLLCVVLAAICISLQFLNIRFMRLQNEVNRNNWERMKIIEKRIDAMREGKVKFTVPSLDVRELPGGGFELNGRGNVTFK